jgi:ribosomal protein S19E (S16A)
MNPTTLPAEALESLRALATSGSEAEVSPPMLQILQEQGYAEMKDGEPTVTESGQALLDSMDRDLPPFVTKAD